MKVRRSIFMPAVVMTVAVISGGWFLQQGVSQEANVYFHVRLLEEVMSQIENQYVEDVDAGDLYQAAIDGVVRELGDPNSTFLKASDWEDIRIRTQGEYGGVGLEVIDRDNYVTVVSPMPGTPGQRAGIKAGDRIVEVDGKSMDGWVTDQAVELLRGKPGAEVVLGIERYGVEGVLPFPVTREVIQVLSVPFSMMLDDRIGYVPLQIFNNTTTEEVRAAVDSLRSEGMKALVMDLRNNPGGLLDEGVTLTDMFLDPGSDIVETRGRGAGESEKFVARAPQAYPGMPIVVLIRERSASAAEIFAGALQDHDRALIVGSTSFGKGSVQSLIPLSGGNYLKLTTARWFTPSGRSIQKPREDQLSLRENGVRTLSGDLAERIDLSDKPTFTSMGGRTLFGGGGITPDVVVLPDTLSLDERESLLRISAAGGGFFAAMPNFALQYLQAHRSLRPDFTISNADIRAFAEVLKERGAAIETDVLLEAGRFVRYHLGREIALQAWGDGGEFSRAVAGDTQLQRALELLRGASDQEALLTVAGTPLPATRPVRRGGGGN